MRQLILILISISILSCKKEEICFKCRIVGHWEVNETNSTFKNNELTNEYGSSFEVQLFEDGTGYDNAWIMDSTIYWTLTPNGDQIFISQNIDSDSFSNTFIFDILTSEEDEIQIWQQEQFFDLSSEPGRSVTKWELTKK